MSCEHCIRESRFDQNLSRLHLQNPNEHFTAPEYAMQNDLVSQLTPPGGYEDLLIAMEVFSR